MSAVEDVDELIERYQQALDEFMKGDPKPVQNLFSHRDDASLANPYGPPVRGWEQIAEVNYLVMHCGQPIPRWGCRDTDLDRDRTHGGVVGSQGQQRCRPSAATLGCGSPTAGEIDSRSPERRSQGGLTRWTGSRPYIRPTS